MVQFAEILLRFDAKCVFRFADLVQVLPFRPRVEFSKSFGVASHDKRVLAEKKALYTQTSQNISESRKNVKNVKTQRNKCRRQAALRTEKQGAEIELVLEQHVYLAHLRLERQRRPILRRFQALPPAPTALLLLLLRQKPIHPLLSLNDG